MLLNPGRTSRHYLRGLAAAAERAGWLAGTVDLGPMWAHLQRAGPAARHDLAVQAREQCERLGVTHVLGYVHNGVLDLAVERDPHGGVHPVSPFVAAGARHILLWTDHPNWAVEGSSLRAPASAMLAHPMHHHWLKSPAAAAELAVVAGWPNVFALPMAEDPAAFQPPVTTVPQHDAVVILSDAAATPPETLPFLDEQDPDPAAVMRAMRPAAIAAFRGATGSAAAMRGVLDALADDWIEAKIRRPLVPFFRLREELPPHHAEALAWLAGDATRWYAALAALHRITAWRRSFWIAWLGSRVNFGVFGSSAAPLGIAQPPGADRWVPYEHQAAVYRLGACAININAAHDEEGLTHKPFQIAAASAACVHHASLGAASCFEPGEETLLFERGPALLGSVRSLAADRALRRRLADCMHARATSDHTWDARLAQVIERTDVIDRPAARPAVAAAG